MLSKLFKQLRKHDQLTKIQLQRWNDPEGNVIKLSSYSIIKNRYNFCPTTGYYNKKELKIDINKFERKINPKAFELKEGNKTDKNDNTTSDVPNIKPISNWEPQMNHHAIKTFIEAVVNNIREILEYKQTLPWNNISRAD